MLRSRGLSYYLSQGHTSERHIWKQCLNARTPGSALFWGGRDPGCAVPGAAGVLGTPSSHGKLPLKGYLHIGSKWKMPLDGDI